MGLTKLEQETGITWNEAEDTAVIWTTSPVSKRRFTTQFGPGTQKGAECLEWIVPRRLLTVRRKTGRASRPMTDTQKAALAAGRARARQ